MIFERWRETRRIKIDRKRLVEGGGRRERRRRRRKKEEKGTRMFEEGGSRPDVYAAALSARMPDRRRPARGDAARHFTA